MRVIQEGSPKHAHVEALDGPGPGGASYHYVVKDVAKVKALGLVHFQEGLIRDIGPNGVTDVSLLQILKDRFTAFQAGPFHCTETGEALIAVDAALAALEKRSYRRDLAGIEGQAVETSTDPVVTEKSKATPKKA